MGVVYRGFDTVLRRPVAIKVLDLTGQEGVEELRLRFIREARALAGVCHPNVATIFDAGAHEGRPYIVMELVDGASLRELLEGSAYARTPFAVRQGWVLDVARALAEIHGVGLVHRDVKPSNVVVSSRGVAKIIDFGVAKGSHLTQLTGEHMMMGTPAYMAPEQYAGARTDARSDQYAWGRLGLEVLGAGSRSNPTARQEMPAALLYVLRRATSDNPELRFGSMAEILAGLAECGLAPADRAVAGVALPFPSAEPTRPSDPPPAAGDEATRMRRARRQR